MRRVLVCVVAASLVLAAGAASASAAQRRSSKLRAPEPCPGCWHPALNTSWQWQLQWKVDTSVDVEMYDIDMFDNSTALVGQLHADGRHVVCCISAGTWENWRPDADQFPASVPGATDGCPGARWLDVRER